ncbi:hypothetical protein YWA314_10807 [Yersinia enterocolitica subsp. enterocolitica WA-314]|nr:hypothetical protein YWA314_10807 [Yersinia enterocolitica subsp. enterocolitica WA-314]
MLQGEDWQKSKASAPRMARLEPPGKGLRGLYDLPVFTATGTLSLTSSP